ncbi:MAG: ABC transporter permease, partial [Verrucomicrobiota bacterium]
MRLFLLQLSNEFKKLFARKRTYIGFAAFLVVECAVLFLLNLPKPKEFFRRTIERNGYGFDEYFSGLTLALFMLEWTTLLLGGLYLSLVAGDMVAKEIEDGTMRMMLCRPVSRIRILVVKYLACLGYTAALIGFIGLTALVAGICYRGTGGLFVFAPLEKIFALHPMQAGLLRYFGSLVMLTLSLSTITSLGFLFSCLKIKPAAATILTLSLIFLDSIFRNIPYFESLQPYFITTHMATWLNVFVTHIPWETVIEDYAYLFGINATCLIV